MAIVYANIGSNMGDRESLIARALEMIGQKFGYYCTSKIVESEPWGFSSTNFFYNIGVAFKSEKHPEDILRDLQAIEKSISAVAHRNEMGHYKDREIDIDIMAIDEIIYRSATLLLPHKNLMERDFFMGPLKELNESWSHPEAKIRQHPER